MEDIYSDLENYQYENIVSELRNENQELKSKIQEYASTLGTLQKDFDKLSEEYKKLELNYSSLLKTARAEIERKSQLITNLNIEKDKLVIDAIQNRRRVPHKQINSVGNKQQTGKSTKERDLSKEVQHVATPTSTASTVSVTLNHERKDKHNKTKFSLDPPIKDNTDLKEKEQKSNNTELYANKEKSKNGLKKTKENHSDAINNTADSSNVSKISNRRKSMPLLNRGDFKFSSDEDQGDASKDHRFRRKTPIRDDKKVSDRVYHDKYRNGRNESERKISELTRTGDKYASNYDSSRDCYRKSNSWYRDTDRHISRDNRDRYESSQKSRRQYSPDRPINTHGEYYNKYRDSNDRPHRSDYVRHRTLISPPPDKYNQHRRNREFDEQKFQQEAVFPMKHKMHDLIEEPARKRLRTESLNKQSDKYTSSYDRDVDGRANSMSRPLELSYLSLQSPDYVHLENNPPVHQIKEIKCTSDTKLDDPRLTNKNYIVYTHRDKIMLSTVVGRNVDIKAIDTSVWDTDKGKHIHEMPTPLRERPSISEDLVKDIYMGIDNPISNLSLESGEICLEEEMGTLTENKSLFTVNPESMHNNVQIFDQVQNEVNKTEGSNIAQNKQQFCPTLFSKNNEIEVNKREGTDIINDKQTCPTLLSKNYKIPKIKKSCTSKLLDNDSTISTRNKPSKRDNTKQSHKKKNHKEKFDAAKLQPEANDCKTLKIFSDAIDDSKNKRNKSVDKKNRKQSPVKAVLSARDTVVGDLELSDETCDYLEISDQTRYDKENNAQKPGECNKDAVIESINKDLNIGEPDKSDPINKKHENETRENKQFNISHKDYEGLPKELLSNTNKEQKSKDIKSKLCDLFGDTSSLITLDDLGFVAPSSTKENLNEYAPLFENTQDAVDLNVEEMEKVQTRSMKLKRDEDKPVRDEIQKIISEQSVKNKDENSTNKESQTFNNYIEKSSLIQHTFENVNTEPEDNNVVKTVIISTGIQNNCDLVDVACNREQEKQLTNIDKNTNDNATNCPALLSIKALATSTPHKPQIEPSLSSKPEVSCNANNSAMANNASNISSNTESICKSTQSNLDIPDVRIIVKRRRKAKGAP